MGEPPALRVEAVRKAFPSGREETVAVDDVSFTVAPGESLALVGESGSGKTTIARILVGLERADSGAITVGDHEIARPQRGRRARLRRARAIQLVFQNPYGSLDPALTIERGLLHALALHDISDREDRAADLLDRVGLGERERHTRPSTLSGGQLQRAAIARALCVEPEVLVLDEAVAALDVSIQAQILQLLDELRRDLGLTCVFISHDLAVVEAISDRIAVLRRGRLVEYGDTTSVLRDPEDAYTKTLLDSVPRLGWVPSA